MIIYYICAVDISNYDAQRTHILEIVSAWQRNGIDVTLFVPQYAENPERFSFPHQYIPVWFRKKKLKFLEYEIRLAFSLIQAVKRKRADIIYIRKGFLTLIPVVLSRIFKIKCVVEVNGFVRDEVHFGFGLPLFIAKLFDYPERLTCRLADRIITVTAGLKQIFEKVHHIDAGQIRVVSNGVNIDRFEPSEKGKDEVFYLGFVGNLVPWSGLDYLMNSLPLIIRHYPNIKCLIVGDGPYRKHLITLVRSLAIQDHVIFTGSILPDQVPGYINQCQICYIPAIRKRNARIGISPLKLYEYLACGIPVIVTNIGGMEMVAEYGVGMVVKPESSAALAEATIELIANPESRKEMSYRARQVAIQNFSWDRISRKILDIFLHVLDEKSKS